MDTDILSSVYDMVRAACCRPSNIFGFGIWSHHIRPMLETAKDLAELHDADPEMVLLSVLLHDYAGISNEAFIEEHHIHGANEARRLLAERSYPSDRIAIIEDAIRAHRGSIPGDKSTNEARCLADCDAISHIQQFPSLFYVVYRKRARSIEVGAQWVREKLTRDWDKLSPIGRDYIRDTYTGLMNALETAADASRWTGDKHPSWGST
jgi:uncharacterized protein